MNFIVIKSTWVLGSVFNSRICFRKKRQFTLRGLSDCGSKITRCSTVGFQNFQKIKLKNRKLFTADVARSNSLFWKNIKPIISRNDRAAISGLMRFTWLQNKLQFTLPSFDIYNMLWLLLLYTCFSWFLWLLRSSK